MRNSGQHWETELIHSFPTCNSCRNIGHAHGVKVTEYRHGKVHQAVVVCLQCMGRMVKHKFHMSQLRGR